MAGDASESEGVTGIFNRLWSCPHTKVKRLLMSREPLMHSCGNPRIRVLGPYLDIFDQKKKCHSLTPKFTWAKQPGFAYEQARNYSTVTIPDMTTDRSIIPMFRSIAIEYGGVSLNKGHVQLERRLQYNDDGCRCCGTPHVQGTNSMLRVPGLRGKC